MKRVLVAVNVPDDYDKESVAIAVDSYFGRTFHVEADSTVWSWADFWLDYEEGVVGPNVEPDPSTVVQSSN